jgi:epoxide hydrolase-like predicted phosphatase
MNEGIKAIIFDIGGVLQVGQTQKKRQKQKHSSGVHETIAKKLKISLDQYFDAIDTAYAKSIEGKISKKDLLKILSENLKISEKKIEKLYLRAYKKEFRLNKQLFKQAFKLKKKGYKIAILSDQWHLSKEAHMPKKWFKKFDVLVVSCEVGMRKPNPKIYQLVLKKLKLKPLQTVFIDNQEWNIRPAKKIGMKSIRFTNNKQLFRDLKNLGVEI